MLLLIIGPSAVGKTATTRRYAEKYGNCTLINLDDAATHLNGKVSTHNSMKHPERNAVFGV